MGVQNVTSQSSNIARELAQLITKATAESITDVGAGIAKTGAEGT